MILGITGHRPPGLMCSYDIPNPTYNKIYETIKNKFIALSPEKIISGMAQGVDQWSVLAAIELKIPFIAAVPCDGQYFNWPKDSIEKYKTILNLSEDVVVVSPGPYSPEKMHIRDRWIVDNSDQLLAIWNGIRKGGTFATIRHAEKQQVNNRKDYVIHKINPNEL